MNIISRAAAFGRLCVETFLAAFNASIIASSRFRAAVCWNRAMPVWNGQQLTQPLSGGCVLKQRWALSPVGRMNAATFGWLCVETALSTEQYNCAQAEKQREDEIKKINSNFKYEIK